MAILAQKRGLEGGFFSRKWAIPPLILLVRISKLLKLSKRRDLTIYKITSYSNLIQKPNFSHEETETTHKISRKPLIPHTFKVLSICQRTLFLSDPDASGSDTSNLIPNT
jgi:hypothetical protein